MQRDMSYELDGIFSTRNQGGLVAALPQQTQMIRTPGLMPVSNRNLGALDPGGAPDSINVPFFGPMKSGTILIAVGMLGLIAAYAMKKSKEGKPSLRKSPAQRTRDFQLATTRRMRRALITEARS